MKRAMQIDKTPWLRNRRTGVRRFLKKQQRRAERRDFKLRGEDAANRRLYNGYD